MMLRMLPMLATTIFLTLTTIGGAAEMQFTVKNPAEVAQRTVARIALPVPAGEITDAPEAVALRGAGVPAQANVITRHPDGSVRRMMLSVPVELGRRGTKDLELTGADVKASPSMLTDGTPARIATDAFDAIVSEGNLQLLDADGRVTTIVRPFGPDPEGDEITLTVLEDGPQYTWLRFREDGEEWSQEIDVEISRIGEIKLTHRIQAHPEGDHWTPDFGFDVTAPGADGTPREPVHFMQYDTSASFADHPEVLSEIRLSDGTVVTVANPLTFRQNRGTLEVDEVGGITLRSNRNEPVEDLESEGLMIQEGSWRFSELVIAPVERGALAAALDDPVYAHADWRLYDAVYGTGHPLEVDHPVLRDSVEKMVYALQDMQMKGDDLGSMPWSWDPARTSPDYTSSVRLNHSLYVWEDWLRGGDARLRQVAYDWLRNYHDLGMYWGPNEEFYGACRRGNLWRDRPGHGPGTFNP
ncbi:MAG: hypothetical protein R6V07_18770, partial [Armatimonadota bacterium]